MRSNGAGGRVQRAEVRFDGISGCLRTPTGGSSKQTVLIIEKRPNPLSSSLAKGGGAAHGLARLLRFTLTHTTLLTIWPEDGVVAPVVRHLSQHIFEPLLMANQFRREEAAA